MAFLPTPEGVEVVVDQLLHSEQVVNVLHVQASQPEDGFTLAAIAGAVRLWWFNTLRLSLSQDIHLTSVTARDISQEGGQASVLTPVGDYQGAINQAALPSSVAFCVTHRTARTGRSYRGRTYVAGLAEGDVAGNVITLVRGQELAAAFNTLRTDLEALTFTLAVKSTRNQLVVRPAGVLTPIVNSVARDLVVDNQRRRLQGH